MDPTSKAPTATSNTGRSNPVCNSSTALLFCVNTLSFLHQRSSGEEGLSHGHRIDSVQIPNNILPLSYCAYERRVEAMVILRSKSKDPDAIIALSQFVITDQFSNREFISLLSIGF